MTEQDYRALISLLTTKLRESGNFGIADPDRYSDPDSEAGEAKRYPPKRRLIEMLRALERHLSVQDRNAYFEAVDQINETLGEQSLKSAIFLPSEDDVGAAPISLAEAPDFGLARRQILLLIDQLERDRDTPVSEL